MLKSRVFRVFFGGTRFGWLSLQTPGNGRGGLINSDFDKRQSGDRQEAGI